MPLRNPERMMAAVDKLLDSIVIEVEGNKDTQEIIEKAAELAVDDIRQFFTRKLKEAK